MCDVDEAWFLSLSSRGGRRGSGRGGPLQLGQTDFARRLSQEHTGKELDPSRASSPRPSPPSDSPPRSALAERGGGEGEVGGSVRMDPAGNVGWIRC